LNSIDPGSPDRLVSRSPTNARSHPRHAESHMVVTCFLLVIRWYGLEDCSKLVWIQVNTQHRCKIVAVGDCVVIYNTQQRYDQAVFTNQAAARHI
jgi:hypothetical protein